MIFTSYQFLFVFTPCVLLLYFLSARVSQFTAQLWLLASSLFFYGEWIPRYLFVLGSSIVFNYAVGVLIFRLRSVNRARRWILFLGVSADLLLLGGYKYLFFFATGLRSVFQTSFSVPDLLLPLGISFFTFTQIAFLVDVYRRESVELDFVKYTLFVTYFPHLIAGPIIHHRMMMTQFGKLSTYKVNPRSLMIGFSVFVVGLAKKLLIADSFAKFVDPAFNAAAHGHVPTASIAWTAVLAYTFQLYFDFSGYSDMAVGLSRLFGIQLPINFRSPYKSQNVVEFWRRWHMTLSQFLRDYLYIPLGGNRFGVSRRYVNLMITMILGGLWHGANWTFLTWGLLHGGYLCINHGWRAVCVRYEIGNGVPSMLKRGTSVLLTFASVSGAWVFFRADSLAAAVLVFEGLFAESGIRRWAEVFPGRMGYEFGLLISLAAVVVWKLPNVYDWLPAREGQLMIPSDHSEKALSKHFWLLPCIVACLFLSSIVATFGPTSISPFLYFQF